MAHRKRIRAHANPLSESDMYVPLTPEHIDWTAHYPNFTPTQSNHTKYDAIDNNTDRQSEHTTDTRSIITNKQFRPTIADIGCGFGGLTVALSTTLPNDLIIALEIRDRVVDIVQQRIQKLRQNSQNNEYNNISVINCNVMKNVCNYFYKSQLHKIFFCFPDPHFKRSNYRRRIINQSFLDYYAYVLAVDGLLYFITDVKDLYDWMSLHCTQHPLFERISESECKNDICYQQIHNVTEEGQKVERIHGNKYAAVYRRIAAKT